MWLDSIGVVCGCFPHNIIIININSARERYNFYYIKKRNSSKCGESVVYAETVTFIYNSFNNNF